MKKKLFDLIPTTIVLAAIVMMIYDFFSYGSMLQGVLIIGLFATSLLSWLLIDAKKESDHLPK